MLRFRNLIAAAGAATMFMTSMSAQAGIIYQFEKTAAPGIGLNLGTIELPSLTGASLSPDAFSYLFVPQSQTFTLGNVLGASWAINPVTGAFLNLSLTAFEPLPNILPALFDSFLNVNLTQSINTITNEGQTLPILQTETQAHRLILLDGGGLLTPPTAGIPEPGTLALFGLGLAGLGFARRRKTA